MGCGYCMWVGWHVIMLRRLGIKSVIATEEVVDESKYEALGVLLSVSNFMND